MNDNERNLKILEVMRQQTSERMSWPPEKLREWFRQVHGPEYRELKGAEAEQMLLVLKLIGPYNETNNQRTSTKYYKHAGKTYAVTLGLGDDPLVEEVLPYDI